MEVRGCTSWNAIHVAGHIVRLRLVCANCGSDKADVDATAKLRGHFGALRDRPPDACGRKLIKARLGNPSSTTIQCLSQVRLTTALEPSASVQMFSRRCQLASSTGSSTWRAQSKSLIGSSPQVDQSVGRTRHADLGPRAQNSAEGRMTTIGDKDVLLVKRLDRHKGRPRYLRSRMVSALTRLYAVECRDFAARGEVWAK
jgi:serine/threonine-protein kinase HipA